MSVSWNRSPTGTVDASVRHVKAGEMVTVELANISDANAIYRSLNLTFAHNGSYDLVIQPSKSPAGIPALSIKSNGATPLGYLNVSYPGVADENISNANVTFAVSEERLATIGASAKDVALYRHHDGTWTELDVRKVESTNGTHVFTASTSNLSTSAVGVKRPAISVANVALSDGTVESGNTVTVTAKVTNSGGAAGAYTVTLTAFGEIVDSKELTLAAGESRSVTFVRRIGSPGVYELSVNGENATLQVTGSTPTGMETTTDGTTVNESGQPGFGAITALIVLAAVVLLGISRS